MSKKNNQGTGIVKEPEMTAEEITAALGGNGSKPTETVIVEMKPAVETTPVAEVKPLSELDRYMAGISPELQNQVKSVNEASQLGVAKTFFRFSHPEGMKEEFNARINAEVTALIQKISADTLVDLTGQRVVTVFPNGGQPSSAMFAINTTQEPKGKSGFQKSKWGECTVTDASGKVKAYETPSAMAKSLGLRITGHTDQVHTFTKPAKATGLAWEGNWNDARVITVVSGSTEHPEQGIHVSVNV